MAAGGATKAGSDICISVTGVAGPDTEDGKPVGLVFVGCFCKGDVTIKECHLSGDRESIRKDSVREALQLLIDVLERQ